MLYHISNNRFIPEGVRFELGKQDVGHEEVHEQYGPLREKEWTATMRTKSSVSNE